MGKPPLLPQKDRWWSGSVYETATELGIPIIKMKEILDHEIDLLMSLLFYRIIKEPYISHAKYGTTNFHMAPLPRYRGCNSLAHAIINSGIDGHKKYGMTLHYIDEGIDTGPIIEITECDIEDTDTAWTLYQRVTEQAYDLLKKWLPRLVSEKVQSYNQSKEEKSYFYDRHSLDDIHIIDLKQSDKKIYDKVRALTFPARERPYAIVNGKKIYLSID